MAKYTKFYPRVRSKNHSVGGLRRSSKGLPALPIKSIIRFGSTTPTEQIFRKNSTNVVEINTVDAILNSRSKLNMKQCFYEAGVPQSRWWTIESKTEGKFIDIKNKETSINNLPYPILVKRVYGFKGHGMLKFDTQESFAEWLKTAQNEYPWYIEQYHSYVREYRLHCTANECFYACRKMLRENAEQRWFRNDSNCVWILEENPLFDKPTNWNLIVESCKKALVATKLDIGAFDVRVQSSEQDDPAYIIIEVNSAPAFGAITEQKYKEILPELITQKSKVLCH